MNLLSCFQKQNLYNNCSIYFVMSFVLFISHSNEKIYSEEFMIETVEMQIKWEKEKYREYRK